MASLGTRLGMRVHAPAICARSVPMHARFLSTVPVRLLGAKYPLTPRTSSLLAKRSSASSRTISFTASTPAVVNPSVPTPPAEVSTTTAPSTVPAATPADMVPTSPDAPTSLIDADTVSNLIAPLQYGDFAALGLTGWSPAGLVRSLLEVVHVSTDMPWAATIVATVVLVRLAVLPFHIRAMRSTARLQPYMPRMDALKREVEAARMTNDKLRLQRAALAQKSIYQEAGVSVGAMMLGPLTTLASQLGLFFGIKMLCDLPLKQMSVGGLPWCPDLTMADPTFILPAINMAAIQLSLWSASRDVTNAQGGHMINFMRLISLPGVWFLVNFPAGLNVGLAAGTTFMITQGILLRANPVRRLLGIPIVPKEAIPKLPTMMDTIRNIPVYFQNRMKEAEAKQLRKAARR